MISAEEARMRSEQIQDNTDLESIEKIIIQAINNGAMFCKLSYIPSNNVYTKLKDLGYEVIIDVERKDAYRGSYYTPAGCTISWHDNIDYCPWYARQFKYMKS